MASSKKKSTARKSKAVAKKKDGAGTALVSYRERLAALAQEESQRSVSLGNQQTIRLKKGKFHFQGNDLGSTLEFVCVDFVYTRGWFDSPYDEDSPSAPACFAVSKDGHGVAPHETSPQRQSDLCNNCWADEFGSADNGKGKACREGYLLGIIHPDDLGADEPDVLYLKVPPTSLKAWDSFMVKRNKVLKLPALAFIVEASFDEDVDYQKLEFKEVGKVAEQHLDKLFELRETVHEVLMTPPDASQYVPPNSKGGNSRRGGKKKAAKASAKKRSGKGFKK